jgi:hypothetical protein
VRSRCDGCEEKTLEDVGWRFSDATDFLAVSDEERQMLDARVEATGSSSSRFPDPAPRSLRKPSERTLPKSRSS